MKIFRIIILFITASLLLTSLPSCKESHHAEAKTTVVATNFALFDLARQAYPGDCVMLISPGTESHDFECTLADMATIARAKLVVYGGGEGDDWMDDVLARIAESGDPVPYLRAMDVIDGENELLHEAEALESDGHDHEHDHAHEHEHDHEHDHEDAHDHDHGTYLTAAEAISHKNTAVYVRTDPPTDSDSYDGYDEHVWTDPANAILLLHAVRDALASLDLPTADTAAYENRLLEADAGFRALASSGEIEQLLFADRFPFLYFAHAYDVAYTAAFAGCSSDTEPSLATLSRLLAEMDETDPAAIFVIEFSDRKTAEFLSSAHPCRIVELSSGHNVTKADFDAGVTLADLCERNLAALRDLSR